MSKQLEQAVEVTVAALASSSTQWVDNPDQVAKFVETIYKKLIELEQPKGSRMA